MYIYTYGANAVPSFIQIYAKLQELKIWSTDGMTVEPKGKGKHLEHSLPFYVGIEEPFFTSFKILPCNCSWKCDAETLVKELGFSKVKKKMSVQ